MSGGSRARTTSDGSGSIQQAIARRPGFNARRNLAQVRPERALHKLHGYAVLELKIVKARRLEAADLIGTSDPYVEVYVNDKVREKTHHIPRTLDPVWDWSGSVEIKHPDAVVMLLVSDKDDMLNTGLVSDDLLGFVEFPVSQMPSDGTWIRGWFILEGKDLLIGTSTERIASLEAVRKELSGAIYLEMRLKIASGDPTDESYAWNLPPSTPMLYYAGGVTRIAMDSQDFIDQVMELKSGIQGLLNPFFGCIAYVLSLQDILVSLPFLVNAVGVTLYPQFFMTGWLCTLGLFLLLLSNPHRRLAVAAHPSTVPLSDDGYSVIARQGSTDKMAAFIGRVVATMQGKVIDQERMHEFAAFASYEGEPVTSYAGLKQQLFAASLQNAPFLSCKGALSEGALVKAHGVNGKVLRCLNPDDHLDWKYLVSTSQDGRAACEQRVEEEIHGDHLASRTDLRFLSNPAVLRLIPDSVEDMVQGFHPTVAGLNTSVRNLTKTISDVTTWKHQGKSIKVVLACFTLGLLFVWVQKLIFVIISLFLFIKHTAWWVSRGALRSSGAAALKSASKGKLKWGFFVGEADGPVASSKRTSTGLLASWGVCWTKRS